MLLLFPKVHSLVKIEMRLLKKVDSSVTSITVLYDGCCSVFMRSSCLFYPDFKHQTDFTSVVKTNYDFYKGNNILRM